MYLTTNKKLKNKPTKLLVIINKVWNTKKIEIIKLFCKTWFLTS